MALGHHLGTDQDVRLARGDTRQQGLPLGPGARGVAVDAQHPGAGVELGEALLEPLGAAPEGVQVLVAAGRTGAGDGIVGAAVVAAHAPVGEVHHLVGRAVIAVADPAAGGAGQHRRVAAAVEEHQALLAAFQALADRLQQRGAQAFVEFGAAHVHPAHRGQGGGHGTAGQLELAVTPALGVLPALQRGSGRAQHHRDCPLAGAPHRHVARRIAHAFELGVGGIVFLVDDDHGQPGDRGEYREAGAKHDVGVAAQRLHEAA